ncbi:hypothetical protein KIPB_015953, partial [Kipferlia bialata]|eukprot:g15035.t1
MRSATAALSRRWVSAAHSNMGVKELDLFTDGAKALRHIISVTRPVTPEAGDQDREGWLELLANAVSVSLGSTAHPLPPAPYSGNPL